GSDSSIRALRGASLVPDLKILVSVEGQYGNGHALERRSFTSTTCPSMTAAASEIEDSTATHPYEAAKRTSTERRMAMFLFGCCRGRPRLLAAMLAATREAPALERIKEQNGYSVLAEKKNSPGEVARLTLGGGTRHAET